MGDPLRNRCSWISAGDRCRFVGVWTIDTHGGGGKFYCRGHSNSDLETDPIEHGSLVTAASYREIPGDFDYSSESCRHRARNAYLESKPGVPAAFSKKFPRKDSEDVDRVPF